ncbi:glucose-1-phosphate adenylyltransferase family protein [Marmoricola sp. URHB0036]|uniref:glucose-1-phosphate adenylyltransferase family protein n=1 Tax=Marmoricola sp. URHB0036 TaxID=1298863 RepID=UPI00041A6032|nr:sugar phosphate nucleotidyltransferase [Marmoricola sp. URHB0036]
METTKILAIIQAGGAGGRMDVLTLERAKPALPFGGSYQLLDFPLSNLVNSGVDDVWLSVQYQAAALQEQVRNGRPWDLDRTGGGLRLLIPQQGTGSMDEEGFAHGNADELFRLRDDLRRADPDLVLVMSADHVYRLDYRDVVDTHRAKDAEVTIVVTDLEGVYGEDPADHGVVETNRLGRVTSFAYKPDRPATSMVATEVFLYRPDVLVEVLEELHREQSDEPDEGDDGTGDTGLGDFGDLLLPRFVDRGKVYAHRLDGYWRDLGQPHHYLNAHLELIDRRADLFAADWPIRTMQPQREPTYVETGARLEDSLLSSGSRVAGTVIRSVVGPGVVVEEGAEVVESVLFGDTVVRSGARVTRAIVDRGCELQDGAVVGSADVHLDDADAIPIVGQDSTVGSELPAGARLPPGTTA